MKKFSKLIQLFLLLLIVSACKIESREIPPTNAQPLNPTSTLVIGNVETSIPKGPSIHDIQGAVHRSLLDGQSVENVLGIVTAKKGDGFYMQTVEPDDNIATSEGIFIAIRGVPRVSVGDLVLVSGSVREFNPAGIGSNSLTITQIVASTYNILESGNKLPDPVIIGKVGRIAPGEIIDDDINGFAGKNGKFEPDSDGIDFYESLESMLVQVNNGIAISATSSYKEIAILPDLGEGSKVLSPRGTIVLQENDFNPERILLDDAFVSIPMVNVGDTFDAPIVGILDYTFGNFKLQPVKKISVTSGNLPHDKVVYSLSKDEVAIATYNIENFSASDSSEDFSLLARHIVENLNSPDIVGLQEVQDNDGEVESQDVSADRTFAKIIEGIKQIGGPDYLYLNIDPKRNADGGAPGANIRVGLLYRTDRGLIKVDGTPGLALESIEIKSQNGWPIFSINPGRIDPENYAFRSSRKPLAAMFKFNGEYLYVIVNHLNSKGGDGPLYGDVQPPNLESEAQRISQAKVINKFVNEILLINPNASVIVLGDLNDFPWSNPIKILQGEVLNNLMYNLPIEERYTYIYEGNAQVLDQILVSNSIIAKTSYIQIVHLNSEFYYSERLSDHDPVYAVFRIN